jgi:ribonuclease BN (tRNA processing enzyme)
MKVQILGSCGNQTAQREAVSFIVQTSDRTILIETGPGVTRQVYRSGRKCSDIDSVLVTHLHADHSCGYPYVIWSSFYDRLGGASGKTTIDVAGLSSVTEGLDRILRICYDPDSFPFKIKYHGLSHSGRDVVQFGDLKITSVPVIHTTPNIGLRFDFEGKSVCYSSDTLYCEEFVDLAHDCDVMIHEAFVDSSKVELSRKTKHATASEAGKAARNANAKRLLLVHLFPPLIGNERLLIDEASKEFRGEIVVPNEFDEISIG